MKEREAEEEEEKQNKLREEKIRTMREWDKEKSWEYVKRFRGYRRDTRCKKYGWFGHMAHHCRRKEIKTEREQRGEWFKNR